MARRMDWQHWTGLNRQLLDEWRKLVAANPAVSTSPAFSDSEHFARFCSLTSDILAVFETSHGCAYVSPSWERITGMASDAAMGSDFYRFLSREHRAPFITALQQWACEGMEQLSLYPLEFQLKVADGSFRWFRLRPAAISPAAKQQLRIACLLEDCHEEVTTRAALAQAKREAELALKARSEFFASMSHELRTPLNAILGFTQIMESGVYGEIESVQYREYLRHVRESGYELLAQIDDVMEMATIESGTIHAHRENCDLNELLLHTFAQHRHHAQAAQVTLSCDVRKGYARLSVDRIKLQHCFSQLLANAVRYTRPGGSIHIETGVNDNGELCISLCDDGIGMSSRKLQGLVSALARDDSWNARHTNGLGLGLPLAKEYARLHGGYLTLESKAGSGTRVTVHLPADCVVIHDDKVLRHPALAL